VHLAASQSKIISLLQLQGGDLVARTVAAASSIASLLLNALLCMVMSIYLVLDGRAIHDRIVRLLPQSYRQYLFFIEAACNTVVGGYVRGQLILEATIGILAGLGCWWLGLPYPALLGITAAVLELVPMLGPMLASLLPILLALASAHPWPLTLEVVLYFFAIQQFETHVLGPRITGHAVGLHPLGAIVALLVGAELYGAVGAVVAVPLAGMLYVLAAAIYCNMTGQHVPTGRRRGVRTGAPGLLRRTDAPGWDATRWRDARTPLGADAGSGTRRGGGDERY
jgi:predicted PurR-regulated permease PerM